jgi:probable F420-dependent oxidoreductase
LPSICLAGVGPRMTEMAGEVADGFIVHPFGTEQSLRELTIPALERGAVRGGRKLADVEVAFPLMAVVGETDEQLERGREAMRPRLAFYGSTPAYKVILDVHGWGDLQPELNRLSKTGDWATMSSLITDEMVDAFSVQGTPDEIGPKVRARYGDLVQRISFDTSAQLDQDRVATVLAGLRNS